VVVGAGLVIWWPRPPVEPQGPAAQRSAVQPSGTSAVSPTALPTTPDPGATPSPLTRERALFMMLSAISDGVAEGSIRPDAGLDLQQLLRQAKSEDEIEHVRVKISAREEEGAISAATARTLETALDDLAASF
jgi:hypothetical protein